MIDQNRNADRDAVLFAFHEAYSRPTAAQIIEWTDRYPQYAEDIRAHAAVAREWDAQTEESALAPDESLLATAYSHALNAIYNAQVAGRQTAPLTFQQIIAARKTSVPELARAIRIKRGIVADLVSGRMAGPFKNVFVNAVIRFLNIAIEEFHGAHLRALKAPTLGRAKADAAPTIIVRPYEEIIRTSTELTEAEKRHWLEED